MSHKTRITHASKLKNAEKRWQVTLECGHATVLTSNTKPHHAHCRECVKAVRA